MEFWLSEIEITFSININFTKVHRSNFSTNSAILLCFFYAIFLILMNINGKITDLSLMEEPFLITLCIFLSLTITLLVLVLTIHLEYSLSNIQKFKMKDNYSHELGDILQMILNSAEFNKNTDTKGDQSVNELIIEKCKEARFLITEIRDL